MNKPLFSGVCQDLVPFLEGRKCSSSKIQFCLEKLTLSADEKKCDRRNKDVLRALTDEENCASQMLNSLERTMPVLVEALKLTEVDTAKLSDKLEVASRKIKKIGRHVGSIKLHALMHVTI